MDAPPNARGRLIIRRSLGSPALFAIVYTAIASAIYFSLGVVADHALSMTPAVFLIAGVFFALTAMTYVEGASLHQDRAGSTVFARYAFNEVVSFVAGWAIVLDYAILIAVTSFSATHYLGAFWGPLGRGSTEIFAALAIIAYVAVRNIRGFSTTRVRRITALVVADIALQLLIIVIGLALFFDIHVLVDPIELGSSPKWSEVIFALTVATVAFTGLESASGLAGEVAVGRRGLRRLVASATATVMTLYVGIAVVAMTALPVIGGDTSIARNHLESPMLGVVSVFDPQWLADTLMYVVAALASMTLIAAANSAMLGLSRLAYSLATNRQIPSAIGRLHPTRSTPYVVIAIAAVVAGALVLPQDLELLVGIYAFGALLAFTIAHLSICVLRYREPDRDRPYRMPLSLRIRGGELPVPAALGAAVSLAAWISVLLYHSGARYVGLLWMGIGLAAYVVYRTSRATPLGQRVLVPESALRSEAPEAAYGSILVPLLGTPLDDDLVQTAGRLASDERVDRAESAGPVIEALWVFEVPMALPIDARLPEEQWQAARAALARAKAVGEEYEGVEVATATVRARRAGQAIVEQARRRGVEAIVMGADEPSRIRGGAVLGGRGGPLDDFVGDATKYVVTKAPCRVILTAPPAADDTAPTEPGPPVEPAAAPGG